MSAKDGKELKEKKQPGRKPMTTEEKAAVKIVQQAEKAKADNLKPEGQTAYYVINGKYEGQVSF